MGLAWLQSLFVDRQGVYWLQNTVGFFFVFKHYVYYNINRLNTRVYNVKTMWNFLVQMWGHRLMLAVSRLFVLRSLLDKTTAITTLNAASHVVNTKHPFQVSSLALTSWAKTLSPCTETVLESGVTRCVGHYPLGTILYISVAAMLG